MPKFLIAFALLFAACAASGPQSVNIIGNIQSEKLSKVRYLGSEFANFKAPVEGNKIFFKFPQSPTRETFVIHGIKTIHNSLESKMEIVDGGIDKNHVTIALAVPDKMDKDIDIEISFFGKTVNQDPASHPEVIVSAEIELENHKQTQKEVKATTKASIIEEANKFGPWISVPDRPDKTKFAQTFMANSGHGIPRPGFFKKFRSFLMRLFST